MDGPNSKTTAPSLVRSPTTMAMKRRSKPSRGPLLQQPASGKRESEMAFHLHDVDVLRNAKQKAGNIKTRELSDHLEAIRPLNLDLMSLLKTVRALRRKGRSRPASQKPSD